MKTAASSFAETVPWNELQHAYGPATDIPPLLKQIAAAKGGKLAVPMDELYSRVLHQGTIYSASPPVAHALVELLADAAAPEKLAFYHMLNGFAEASRRALRDGRAIPCCAGGDPVDGAAIRDEILKAHDLFAPDLQNAMPEIRAQAAEILTAFPAAQTAQLARERYFAENDASVRHALLVGLDRLRTSVEDWPTFLEAAAGREDDRANRFLLRAAQIDELKCTAIAAIVDDFVLTFSAINELASFHVEGGDRFFEAAQSLGPERELATLLAAFHLGTDPNLLRAIAERILRVIFHDERTGWEHISYGRLNEDGSEPPPVSMVRMAARAIGMLIVVKLFPFYFRWKVRRKKGFTSKGMAKIDYWQLQGAAPDIPPRLTLTQQTALNALAAKSELWHLKTNLWQLFDLPGAAEELRRFVTDRS